MSEYIYPNIPSSFYPGDTIKIPAGIEYNLHPSNIKKINIQCVGGSGGKAYKNVTNYGGKGDNLSGELVIDSSINALIIRAGEKGKDYDQYTSNGTLPEVKFGGGGVYDNSSSNAIPASSGGGGYTGVFIDGNPIIIAGGGGGASGYEGRYGGEAGLPSGGKAPGGNHSAYTTGGSQTSGGSLVGDPNGGNRGTVGTKLQGGQGGSWGGGGGGGYYGGGGGHHTGGGGGSSYISGHSSCPTKHPLGITLDNIKTLSKNDYADGYCIITILEANSSVKAHCKIDGVIKEIDKMSVKIDGNWKEVDSVYVKVDGNWKKSE